MLWNLGAALAPPWNGDSHVRGQWLPVTSQQWQLVTVVAPGLDNARPWSMHLLVSAWRALIYPLDLIPLDLAQCQGWGHGLCARVSAPGERVPLVGMSKVVGDAVPEAGAGSQGYQGSLCSGSD